MYTQTLAPRRVAAQTQTPTYRELGTQTTAPTTISKAHVPLEVEEEDKAAARWWHLRDGQVGTTPPPIPTAGTG